MGLNYAKNFNSIQIQSISHLSAILQLKLQFGYNEQKCWSQMKIYYKYKPGYNAHIWPVPSSSL